MNEVVPRNLRPLQMQRAFLYVQIKLFYGGINDGRL